MSIRDCLRPCIAPGVQAGLLGGLAVAVFFLLLDLWHLAPLSTPLAISQGVLGPGGFEFDFPVLEQLVVSASVGARLVVVTVLHFLVFGLLGVGVVALRDHLGMPLNVVTGALYGFVVCTGVFFLAMFALSREVLVAWPDLWSILAANVLAGAAMGGYCRLGERYLARTGLASD